MATSPKPRVPLTTFIDFVHAAGAKRISIVRGAKTDRYDPRTDFYKPLRDKIIEFHQGGMADKTLLTKLVAAQSDPKKRTGYVDPVDAYLKFVRKHQISWVKRPPKLVWSTDAIEVSVNPELALEFDDQPTFVKLWLRTERLDRHRIPPVLRLMQKSLGSASATVRLAVLDVRRQKLHIAGDYTHDVDVLLDADATAFSSMYERLT